MFQNTMSKLNTYKSSKCLTYTTILQSLTSTSVIIFRLNHSADMMQVFTLPVTSTVFKMYAMTMVRWLLIPRASVCMRRLTRNMHLSLADKQISRPPDDLWKFQGLLNLIWRHRPSHRRRRKQPLEARQRVRQNYQKTCMTHVLYPVFQEKSIELVSDMSGAYKSYSLMVSMSLSITRKIGYEICAMCFWKYDAPTCGTQPRWHSRHRWAILPNQFLLKNCISNMCHVCFWCTNWLKHGWRCQRQWAWLEILEIKYLPCVFLIILFICGTRPGWHFRRRWAWLGGLWHTWDHSQSITLEK